MTPSVARPVANVMQSHRFDPTLLREYDLRGVVGKTLFEADAQALGLAFGSLAKRRGLKRLAVAYDGRLSSPALEAALVAGLAASGIDVLRIGRGPTPYLYFAAYSRADVDGGVMVTGSHNPAEYNGFKLTLSKESLHGAAIQALGQQAAVGDFTRGQGAIEGQDLTRAYLERLLEEAPGLAPMKVVWDPGHGATAELVRLLVKRLPGEHHLLNAEIDGRFPAHHPDPTVEANLQQLKGKVRDVKADLGIAFDGDGDRVGAVDSLGRVLWGDQLMLLLARDVLSDLPGATIIADVKASQVLFNGVAALGGKPIMWKTGHSHIKAKLKETGAPFAGEMSAHLFFADRYYGYDDGLYAALRLLKSLSRRQETLAAFYDSLPRFHNTPEVRFPCAEDRKAPTMAAVVAQLKAAGTAFLDIDGVRITTDDGWWLLRASNTQDVLVARCESATEEGLLRLKAALTSVVTAAGLPAPTF